MAHIDVRHYHNHGEKAARRAASQVLNELRQEHNMRLETRWEGSTLYARGRGFEASFEAGDDEVRVQARLSFFLLPLRGSIRREIDEYLERFLGEDGMEG